MDDGRCNWYDCDNFQKKKKFYCDIHEPRIELMNDSLREKSEEEVNDEPQM